MAKGTKAKSAKGASKVSALVPAPPTVDASLIRAEATKLVSTIAAQAALLKITDDAAMGKATTMLLAVKELKDKLQEKRDLIVKPLKQHVTLLEGLFKPAKDELEKADATLRGKVLGYRSEQQKRLDEERSQLMAEAEEAQEKAQSTKGKAAVAAQQLAETKAAAALEVSTSGPTRVMAVSSGQVAARKSWTYEVLDVGMVPHEYWTLDGAKLRAAVKAGARTIPGVRIFEEESLAVGGN